MAQEKVADGDLNLNPPAVFIVAVGFIIYKRVVP